MILIAGLPRSGSTLLINILAQNGRVVTDTTTPLPRILSAMASCTSSTGYARNVHDRLLGCAKAVAEHWCAVDEGEVFVMKDRDMLRHRYALPPSHNIVLTLRKPEDIIASLEASLEKYPIHADKYPAMIEDRVIEYMSPEFFLGQNLRAVKAYCTETFAPKIVRYEDLVRDPRATMRYLYTLFPELEFDYDTDDVRQIAPIENDNAFLPFGDHRITEGAIRRQNKNSLPPHVIEIIRNELAWFYELFYRDE